MQTSARDAMMVSWQASTWLDLFIGLSLVAVVIGGLMLASAILLDGGAWAIIPGLWVLGAGLAPLPGLRFMQAHILLTRALLEEVQLLSSRGGGDQPLVRLQEKARFEAVQGGN